MFHRWRFSHFSCLSFDVKFVAFVKKGLLICTCAAFYKEKQVSNMNHEVCHWEIMALSFKIKYLLSFDRSMVLIHQV